MPSAYAYLYLFFMKAMKILLLSNTALKHISVTHGKVEQ